MNIASPTIFLVDDEPSVLKAMAQSLGTSEYQVICFDNPVECLKQLRLRGCDLLITDVKMSGIDGIELLIKAERVIPGLPVLIVTGYADIPMAIKAIKAGAVDFIEKPMDKNTFLQRIKSALEESGGTDPLAGQSLTQTEEEILELITAGKCNKEIASSLRRSVRTIEWYRNRIMRKLNADNIIDIVKIAEGFGNNESS